jgi:exodeoxyribonuclease VII large subunit
VLYPCLVQGTQAPGEIVAALVTAARRRAADKTDVLLLVRGGGSLEDLWAFNDERVVRAVASSPLPLICGVGHETDVTLADLAADLRAATPTAAAELAVPDRADLLAQLEATSRRLQRAARRQLDREAQRLDLLAHRAGRPAARLSGEQHRLSAFAQRLCTALRRHLWQSAEALSPQAARMRLALRREFEHRGLLLDGLAARLRAAHPEHVLSRGYAWVQDASGRPVMRAAELRPAQVIDAIFSDGRASAQISEVRLSAPDLADPMAAKGGSPRGSGTAA